MTRGKPGAKPMVSAMGYLEFEVLPLDVDLMAPGQPEILDYWNSLRGDAFAPRWQDFKLHRLPPDMLPMVVVVDVLEDGAGFVYRFWGTERAMLYGLEGTAKEVREVLPDYAGSIVVDQYRLTMEARAPLLFRNTYPLKPAEKSISITLRLPLSSDGQKIDKLVASSVVLENPDALASYINPEKKEPSTANG